MFKIDILSSNNTKYNKSILDIKYYELVKLEVAIKIYINEILFFQDDYFPILEFLYQFEKWKIENKEKFEYNTIETEENPILSFEVIDDKCIFDSIWKLSTDNLGVQLDEVSKEIERCKKIFVR